MTELLTAAQMKAIEQAAIDSGEVTGLELMERAGRGVVEAVFDEWPELAKSSYRAVVLCGPGNNGGDGFVVARLLKEWGWEVEVFLYGDAAKLPPDARVNYARWVEMGGVQVLTLEAVSVGIRPTLLFDAMFGTGLTRSIPLELANAYHCVKKREKGADCSEQVPCRQIALDCPSGFDCDSGAFLIPAPPKEPEVSDDDSFTEVWWEWWQNDASRRILHADLTIVFHRQKVGHALNPPSRKVQVVDIGLGREDPVHLLSPHSLSIVRGLDVDVSNGGLTHVWPRIHLGKRKGGAGHKFSHGHALIFSGPSGKTGAARLAARGALRIGAGVVTVGCPPDAVVENAAQLNAIMLEVVHDADVLARILQDTRINALCLGPALGFERARELVPVALANGQARERACVLDADALSAYADDPETLFKLTSFHRSVVLTPHAGEFARLFPDLAKRLREPPMSGPAYSKVDATREAAKRAGCVVLFKGADTVIADAEGRTAINSAHYERAAPWLATAGAGDVLAGFITGLLARGFAPMQAAETAAWLHVECALRFGSGLIAEDLPETLPKVFKALGV